MCWYTSIIHCSALQFGNWKACRWLHFNVYLKCKWLSAVLFEKARAVGSFQHWWELRVHMWQRKVANVMQDNCWWLWGSKPDFCPLNTSGSSGRWQHWEAIGMQSPRKQCGGGVTRHVWVSPPLEGLGIRLWEGCFWLNNVKWCLFCACWSGCLESRSLYRSLVLLVRNHQT